MKRFAAFLLALMLCLSLCACGKEAPEAPSAVQEETLGKVTELCCTRQEGRLYVMPLDGSDPRLLVDDYCIAFDRKGDTVVAAFSDGIVRRIDVKTGSVEELFDAGSNGINKIGQYDGGLMFATYTMEDGTHIFKYDYNAKKKTAELFTDPTFWNYVILDNVMYYVTTAGEEGDFANQLAACDLKKGKELWRVNTQCINNLMERDGVIYLYEGDGDYRWYTLNTADGSRTTDTTGLPDDESFNMMLLCSGGMLAEKYNEFNSCWEPHFLTAASDAPLTLAMGQWGGVTVADHCGDYAILRTYDDIYTTVFDKEYEYWPEHYYLFNGADGTYRELTAKDDIQKMFADFTFPVLDSSTARKPLTFAIYKLFCLDSGTGGMPPVCNTTHGAWTAMADRTSDIALLAAPTEEEQAYLKEKGVEVEMKLYGGDGLVFIGNKECGVTDLTLDQVKAIYRGEITNWSELGGVDHPIRVLYRDDQSGSQRLFESMVWKNEEVPDFAALGFDREDEMSTIVNECLYDPYTIGYSIMTYLNDVFSEEALRCFSLNGVAATPDNVKTGEYPLGTKGYVVIRADEPKNSGARRLYDWFGSPVCDHILTMNGITPMSE